MPIDASIPLSVQHPQPEIPNTIGGLMQIRSAVAQTALHQAEAETARIRAEDFRAQADQRNRDNADQQTIQNLMADPDAAKLIASGDITPLAGKVQPKTIDNIRASAIEAHTKLAQADKAKSDNDATNLSNLSKQHQIVADSINGLKALGDDATIAAEAPAVIARLRAQGVIPPGTPDIQITGAKDLDRLAAQNGAYQGVVEGALKIKKSTADVAKTEADTKKTTMETEGTLPISPYQQAQLDAKADKPEATKTAEQQFVDEYQVKHPKAGVAEAQRAFKLNEHIASPEASINQLDRETTRFAKPHEKSVADATSQLEKIDDARAMINGPAEAQALGIPKVLTALVSGAGSGVRITQPELNSIAKARGLTGDIEGFINSVSGQGKLTDTQKKQLTQILDDVKARVQQKRAIANDALDKINGARSRDEIVKIDRETRQKLTGMESAPAASGSQYKVGDMVMYQGKPHKINAINNGKLVLEP